LAYVPTFIKVLIKSELIIKLNYTSAFELWKAVLSKFYSSEFNDPSPMPEMYVQTQNQEVLS
jgi:hypothetical protein